MLESRSLSPPALDLSAIVFLSVRHIVFLPVGAVLLCRKLNVSLNNVFLCTQHSVFFLSFFLSFGDYLPFIRNLRSRIYLPD